MEIRDGAVIKEPDVLEIHLKSPGEFPGGPVFKISAFITRGAGCLPGQGIKIPPDIW